MLKKLRQKIESINWEDAAELSWWVKFVRRQVKLYFYIIRELVHDRCLQQAAALTFTTLLSLVPLFAVAFSLYRSFAGMEGLADRAQNAVFQYMLARPLLEGMPGQEAEVGEMVEPVETMSGPELLGAAWERAERGEGPASFRLYTAALEAEADPERVRDGLSMVRLSAASTARRFLGGLSPEVRRLYFGAAGIPPPAEAGRPGAVPPQTDKAMELFRAGQYSEALSALESAEQEGAAAEETRARAARIYRSWAEALVQQGKLIEAAEHYEAALKNWTDVLVLKSLDGEPARLAVEKRRELRGELGDLLLRLGKEKADLYESLKEGERTAPRKALREALEDLEKAALLLDRSSEPNTALAELLWEESGRQQEARHHYKLALRKEGGTAARGLSLAAADYIRRFVDKVGRARIGIVATLFLIVAATSLLNTTEKTLNHIWKVSERRPFWIRFTSFWTLICLGPVLIGTAIWVQEKLGGYVTVTFTRMPVLGAAVRGLMAVGQYVVPFLMTWLLLLALYKFLPHTRVQFRSAAWGAALGAVLVELARPMFALYVVHAVKYQRIYGSLGVIPIFLLWLWLLWVIVLFGAEVAFTMQNLSLLRYHDKLRRLSDAFVDRHLAARIMMYVSREFWETGEPVTAGRLGEILQITPEEAADAANRLVNLGLLTPVGDQRDQFHPARDLSRLRLSDVLNITERFGVESRSSLPENQPYEEKLEAAFREASRAEEEALAGRTFRDLLEECEQERDKWPHRRTEEGS